MWAQGRLGAFFVFIFLCVPRRQLSAGWMWREITAEITLTTTTPNISAELQAASQPIARLSLIFTQCHDLRLRTENSCEHDSYPLSLSLLFLFLPAVQFHFFLDLLNITFPPASIFCLPSSRRSSVCRKTTLRFRSHARWPKPNLPHPPQMCVCFSHMSVSLYICMCVCVLKLVLQNASGWTHTIEHEARSVCVRLVFSPECNLISPDSERLLVYSISCEPRYDGSQLDWRQDEGTIRVAKTRRRKKKKKDCNETVSWNTSFNPDLQFKESDLRCLRCEGLTPEVTHLHGKLLSINWWGEKKAEKSTIHPSIDYL